MGNKVRNVKMVTIINIAKHNSTLSNGAIQLL